MPECPAHPAALPEWSLCAQNGAGPWDGRAVTLGQCIPAESSEMGHAQVSAKGAASRLAQCLLVPGTPGACASLYRTPQAGAPGAPHIVTGTQ